MESIIRQASIADKDAILDFVKVAYADYGEIIQQKMLQRWIWQYRENPYIDSGKDNLTILITTKGDQIVGQACMTPVKLKIEDQYYTAFWGTDFIVLAVCRGEGIGKKLMQIEVELAKFMIGLNMPPVTRGIAAKLGYKTLDTVPVYWRLIRFDDFLFFQYLMKATKSKPVVKRIAKTLWKTLLVGKLVGILTTMGLGLRNFFERRLKKNGPTIIQEIQNFDERIDQLWSLTNHQFGVIVKRDREYLNWRYSLDSTLNYRKFVASRDGEIKGYIVLRKEEPAERNFGIIVDLYASCKDQQTIDDLLRHALLFFDKEVTAIECATSIEEFQKALSNFGFLKMERAVPMFYCENSTVAAKLTSLKTKCFFTKGDHDWDQFSPFGPV